MLLFLLTVLHVFETTNNHHCLHGVEAQHGPAGPGAIDVLRHGAVLLFLATALGSVGSFGCAVLIKKYQKMFFFLWFWYVCFCHRCKEKWARSQNARVMNAIGNRWMADCPWVSCGVSGVVHIWKRSCFNSPRHLVSRRSTGPCRSCWARDGRAWWGAHSAYIWSFAPRSQRSRCPQRSRSPLSCCYLLELKKYCSKASKCIKIHVFLEFLWNDQSNSFNHQSSESWSRHKDGRNALAADLEIGEVLHVLAGRHQNDGPNGPDMFAWKWMEILNMN